MRRFIRFALALLMAAATLVGAASSAYAFSDVASGYWDYSSIMAVASARTWMQDYGTSAFKPRGTEPRKLLARTLVKAWAPNEPENANITFPDLPQTDPFYHYANIATKLKWIPRYPNGNWGPNDAVRTYSVDRALTRAVGLSAAASGLRKIHEADGDTYSVGKWFPYMQLAHALGLHYNHGDDSLDIDWDDYITRDEVAYSVWKAYNLESWEIRSLARFEKIALAGLSESSGTKRALTQYALRQVGKYPYIYGGEWNDKPPSGYCCGMQPRGGMDCSGFAWWLMKKYESGYNAARFHPAYPGWSLAQRGSADMARNTPNRISFGSLKVGDLMFFATNGGTGAADVDHVGVFLGNDWMVHTSSSNNGTVLEYVGSGWYYDEFVFGRRIIGTSTTASVRPPPDIASQGDRI